MSSQSRPGSSKSKPKRLIGVVYRNIEDKAGKTVAERRRPSTAPREKPFIRLGSTSRATTVDPLLHHPYELHIDDGDLAQLFSDDVLEPESPQPDNPEENGGTTVRIAECLAHN
jgi:hypothetical protein